MARRYLKVGEIIPPGAWFKGLVTGKAYPATAIGEKLNPADVGYFYIEVPDAPPTWGDCTHD